MLRVWACYKLLVASTIAVLCVLQNCCTCFTLFTPFAKTPTYATLVKMRCNGGMVMILSLEQITNDIWNISQLAKSRKSQRIKKSTMSQT